MIDNETADNITKGSRNSLHNNSKTVTNEEENIGIIREIPRERYVSPEKRQKIIDDIRLI